MRESTSKKIIEIANYIIENKATNQEAASHFGLAKDTVKKYMNRQDGLISIDYDLYLKVKKVKEEMVNLSKQIGGQAIKSRNYNNEYEKTYAIAEYMVNNKITLTKASVKFGQSKEELKFKIEKLDNKKLVNKAKKLFE